jgi:hypothetical protein
MSSSLYTRKPIIIAVLVLQLLPLLLFPAETYSPTTQAWWLPMFLVVMAAISVFQLVVRCTPAAWPWYLMAFAQGFNIISRLMMLWPNTVRTSGQTTTLNGIYLVLTFVSMGLSALLLWYFEKPAVRMGLLRT